MGTTLIRGAGIIGGIEVMTCPGAKRTTGATGGLGITGTADSNVVRTGGGTEEGGGRGIDTGGAGLGKDAGMGGW